MYNHALSTGNFNVHYINTWYVNCSGSFRHVRKTAKSDSYLRNVSTSVRLSVRMEQLDSHWTDFDETSYLDFYRKSVEKIKLLLKSDKNNGYFTRRRFHIYDDISLSST
jgi:hypothetical protein